MIEIAIIGSDMQEVIGTAIAFYLLSDGRCFSLTLFLFLSLSLSDLSLSLSFSLSILVSLSNFYFLFQYSYVKEKYNKHVKLQ